MGRRLWRPLWRPLWRRLWRFPAVVALVLGGVAWELIAFPMLGQQARRRTIRVWSRCLLWVSGVRVRVFEPRPGYLAEASQGRMLISNHVSWMDIFAINSIAPTAFIAKSEIDDWPLIGLLVRRAGTIYIRRNSRFAIREVIQSTAERLRSGYPAGLFAEGTTSDGRQLLPFRNNLFAAAVQVEAELITIGIRYSRPDGSLAPEAWFIGDTTFAQSAWMLFGARRVLAELHVSPAIPSIGLDRHALSDLCRQRMAESLGMEEGGRKGPDPIGPDQTEKRSSDSRISTV